MRGRAFAHGDAAGCGHGRTPPRSSGRWQIPPSTGECGADPECEPSKPEKGSGRGDRDQAFVGRRQRRSEPGDRARKHLIRGVPIVSQVDLQASIPWRAAPIVRPGPASRPTVAKNCYGSVQRLTPIWSRPRLPCTNNVSERHLRPSVIFRKVTNGFRCEWGAETYAAFRSVVSTAKAKRVSVLDTIRFVLSSQTAREALISPG